MALLMTGLPTRAKPAQAAYPGDNGKLVFVQSGEMFTVNPDGTGAVNITNRPGAEITKVQISPTGTQVLFTVAPGSVFGQGLFVTDIRGSYVRNLVAGRDLLFVGEGTWSPDGRRIAFAAANSDDRNEMFVMNADGSRLRQITECDCVTWNDSHPRWSPVSNEIAFQPSFQVNQIWTVTPGTGATRQIVASEGPAYHFEWSPDGRRIAFDNLLYVFVADVATGVITQLTPGGQGTFADPAWSPDGSEIAAEYAPDGNNGIYAIDPTTGTGAGGAGARQIYNPLGWQENPEWGPLCEGRCEASTTSLRVRKTFPKVIASGAVVPLHPGKRVAVRYERKTPTGWAQIAVRRPLLDDGSRFRTAFDRNRRPNRCRVVALFGGDVDTRRSRKTASFKC